MYLGVFPKIGFSYPGKDGSSQLKAGSAEPVSIFTEWNNCICFQKPLLSSQAQKIDPTNLGRSLTCPHGFQAGFFSVKTFPKPWSQETKTYPKTFPKHLNQQTSTIQMTHPCPMALFVNLFPRLAVDLRDGRLQSHHRGGQVRLRGLEALLRFFSAGYVGLKNDIFCW